MPYLSTSGDKTVVICLHVQPKASKTKVVGLHDGCLKLAVTAPPVEGKANEDVIKSLAKMLGIPARDISLKSGAQSRKKRVVIVGMNETVIRRRIEAILNKNR